MDLLLRRGVASRWLHWHAGAETVRLVGQGGGRVVFRVQRPEAPVKSQGNQEVAFLPEGGWLLSGHKPVTQ